MLSALQYRLLRSFHPPPAATPPAASSIGESRIEQLLGSAFLAEARGKIVLDFGCGEGLDAIKLALTGASKVIGLDIREDVLATARLHADRAGVAKRCEFSTTYQGLVDTIVSIDAFEHFADPAAMFRVMAGFLPPGGALLISFGPTWFHPLGGHLFSVFPWAHLLFSETALLRWRADFRNDGATRFAEVAGGLNQMTISRFEALVRQSPFVCEDLVCVPIHKLAPLHNRWTREFTSSLVRCRLRKP